jgi:hypothetical protein
MSAFLCTDDHITAICTFACNTRNVEAYIYNRGMRQRIAGMDHGALFRLLKQANLDSLTARYGDGPTVAEERTGTLRLPVVDVIKAIDCLAYQSCEVADWDATDAAKTLDSIREAAIDKLPGYDEAAWAIPPGTATYHNPKRVAF